MLSRLCLPKSISSIPSTSGGLRALVTKALKHKDDKYNSRAHGSCGVHHWWFLTSSLEEKTRGRESRSDCVSVSSDKLIHILG